MSWPYVTIVAVTLRELMSYIHLYPNSWGLLVVIFATLTAPSTLQCHWSPQEWSGPGNVTWELPRCFKCEGVQRHMKSRKHSAFAHVDVWELAASCLIDLRNTTAQYLCHLPFLTLERSHLFLVWAQVYSLYEGSSGWLLYMVTTMLLLLLLLLLLLMMMMMMTMMTATTMMTMMPTMATRAV